MALLLKHMIHQQVTSGSRKAMLKRPTYILVSQTVPQENPQYALLSSTMFNITQPQWVPKHKMIYVHIYTYRCVI